MKFKTLFFVLLSLAMMSASAQKFKKGSVDFLKNESKVNLVFDFNGLTLDGDSEASYIKERMADENTPEEAQDWKNKWEGEWRTKFKNTFTKYCNDELKNLVVSQSSPESNYTILVKIIDIDPGNFAGPFSNPSKLKADFLIFKTDDMKNYLETLSLNKIYNPWSATQPVEYLRIEMGFGELGKTLGQILDKALK
jgi:hypothetical protein